MPIKGLTDRPAQFPEIGRIRKGGPKTEEGHMGKDLDYFRVEFDEEEVRAQKMFNEAYPHQPKELNIYLPFNSIDENFEAWRERYVAGGLIHRCDGEYTVYQINKEGNTMVVDGEPKTLCDQEVSKCKPVGRLKVLLAELPRLAYMTVLTSSIHDIVNLSRQLEAILQINGRLAGVPLKLRRRNAKISTPSGTNGKRARRVKSLLSIEADPGWVERKLLAMKAAATPQLSEEEINLIGPPAEVVDIEPEEVVDVEPEEAAEPAAEAPPEEDVTPSVAEEVGAEVVEVTEVTKGDVLNFALGEVKMIPKEAREWVEAKEAENVRYAEMLDILKAKIAPPPPA